jgi:hypothetical protein
MSDKPIKRSSLPRYDVRTVLGMPDTLQDLVIGVRRQPRVGNRHSGRVKALRKAHCALGVLDHAEREMGDAQGDGVRDL